jgi:hypothetical protein
VKADALDRKRIMMVEGREFVWKHYKVEKEWHVGELQSWRHNWRTKQLFSQNSSKPVAIFGSSSIQIFPEAVVNQEDAKLFPDALFHFEDELLSDLFPTPVFDMAMIARACLMTRREKRADCKAAGRVRLETPVR